MIVERTYEATTHRPETTVRARVERVNDRVYEVYMDHGRIGKVIHTRPDGIDTWTPRTLRGGNLNRANTLTVAVRHLIDRVG